MCDAPPTDVPSLDENLGQILTGTCLKFDGLIVKMGMRLKTNEGDGIFVGFLGVNPSQLVSRGSSCVVLFNHMRLVLLCVAFTLHCHESSRGAGLP